MIYYFDDIKYVYYFGKNDKKPRKIIDNIQDKFKTSKKLRQ